MYLSVKELAEYFGMSSQAMNKILSELKLQEKVTTVFSSSNNHMASTWKATADGVKYAIESWGQWPGLRWDEKVKEIIAEYLKNI